MALSGAGSWCRTRWSSATGDAVSGSLVVNARGDEGEVTRNWEIGMTSTVTASCQDEDKAPDLSLSPGRTPYKSQQHNTTQAQHAGIPTTPNTAHTKREHT